jgi:hypothetical protein
MVVPPRLRSNFTFLCSSRLQSIALQFPATHSFVEDDYRASIGTMGRIQASWAFAMVVLACCAGEAGAGPKCTGHKFACNELFHL